MSFAFARLTMMSFPLHFHSHSLLMSILLSFNWKTFFFAIKSNIIVEFYFYGLWIGQLILIFVFFLTFLQANDDIGDIFQDQENMAAILIRKHLQTGDLMMVSNSFLFFRKFSLNNIAKSYAIELTAKYFSYS